MNSYCLYTVGGELTSTEQFGVGSSMFEHSPKSILGHSSSCVCDFDSPSRFYKIGMETRATFDESNSWQIDTSILSRRGLNICIDDDANEHMLTIFGAKGLDNRTTKSDHSVSNTLPTNGKLPGGTSFDSIFRRKERKKETM